MKRGGNSEEWEVKKKWRKSEGIKDKSEERRKEWEVEEDSEKWGMRSEEEVWSGWKSKVRLKLGRRKK